MPNHHAVTDYAPPVLRAPSPPSSVGSERPPAFDSDPDIRLSSEDFERGIVDTLGLYKQRREEIEAEKDPLIPYPNSEQDRKRRYEEAMRFLRRKVAEVIDDELVDRTLLRGSQVGFEPQPSSNDIDTIMRSLMNSNISPDTPVTDGPWLITSNPLPTDNPEGMLLVTGDLDNKANGYDVHK
ncbi:hypothetical protein ONZ45_g6242 [Pleurotus djamor]|nr:hypothetical protein ONZ45_g6242 [Pleurotus djamor]